MTNPAPEHDAAVRPGPNGRAHPEDLANDPSAFTIAVLPDTQKYAKVYDHHFDAQTRWLAEQAERLNIRYVVHLGDVTNNNTTPEWEVVDRAMARLDGVLPYAMVSGNHDYHDKPIRRSNSQLSAYFPVERFARWETFGEVMESGSVENSYHTFEANGLRVLVVALEYAPRDETIAWANEVVRQHPEHLAILVTHAYLYYDGQRYDYDTFGTDQRWSPRASALSEEGTVNDGEQLWQKLVRVNPQFRLTLNGHVLGPGVARRCDPAEAGHDVHQLLVNYQMLEEGGSGYLRLLTFRPDAGVIESRTYSPSLNRASISPGNAFTLPVQFASQAARLP